MTTTACKMTESEYRSHPALNASRFKAFIRSPFHFKNQVEVETTEAMKIGTAIHTALLEPELFAKTIAFMPECDRRTTEGKNIAKEFEKANLDKLILKHDSEEIVTRCLESVKNHPLWMKLVKDKINKEVIILSDLRGVDCKGKIDIIDLKNKKIWDLKTCQDASSDKFAYEVKDRLYWVQQAFYKLLVDKHYGEKFDCGFIAVETTDPSGCAFYDVDAEELNKWCNITEYNLLRYKACLEQEDFHGYASGKLPAINVKNPIIEDLTR